MPFRVQVGPPQIAIHHDQTILVTGHDGQIDFPSDKGLYFRDTRVISSWRAYSNGASWVLLNGGAIDYYAAKILLTNDAFSTQSGQVPARSLSFAITRGIDGGMHEDLDVTNYGDQPAAFSLELSIRCDFADVFEVKSGKIVRRGLIETLWDQKAQSLSYTYRNQDFERSVTVRARHAKALYANGRLSFGLTLSPGESWRCCLFYDLGDGGSTLKAPRDCVREDEEWHPADLMKEWRDRVLSVETSNEEYYRFFHQAVEDMAALRLQRDRNNQMVFIPAAGLPWFVAPFGRDSLIVSLQNIITYPQFARGALTILGDLQATERDDYRDAEPGKIMHELRYGELAHFKLIPHTPYYGTADATPLWLITLHAAWQACGDTDLLHEHLPTAEACLDWIDRYGDRDGDGFQEYETRSPDGYENMSWKDSGDAVMQADGSPVKGPKALCELQGYVYDAWLRMAQVYTALGEQGKADALRNKAAALFRNFNKAFWDAKSGFYAFALDGEKNKVLSVVSNPGHCLWSGIVPANRARRVVKRLMKPDMWSGWGIRTLSAEHPSFNPLAYQLGAIWPHDNSIIAMGFRRYGFAREAAMIARDISRAASYFQGNEIPELFAGIQRNGTDFPVQYLGANVPQAWASGSAFMLLQAMLGLFLDAPAGKLYLDPALPDWLPDVAISNLTLGEETFALRFWREGKKTRYKVEAGNPDAVEQRRFFESLDEGATWRGQRT